MYPPAGRASRFPCWSTGRRCADRCRRSSRAVSGEGDDDDALEPVARHSFVTRESRVRWARCLAGAREDGDVLGGLGFERGEEYARGGFRAPDRQRRPAVGFAFLKEGYACVAVADIGPRSRRGLPAILVSKRTSTTSTSCIEIHYMRAARRMTDIATGKVKDRGADSGGMFVERSPQVLFSSALNLTCRAIVIWRWPIRSEVTMLERAALALCLTLPATRGFSADPNVVDVSTWRWNVSAILRAQHDDEINCPSKDARLRARLLWSAIRTVFAQRRSRHGIQGAWTLSLGLRASRGVLGSLSPTPSRTG